MIRFLVSWLSNHSDSEDRSADFSGVSEERGRCFHAGASRRAVVLYRHERQRMPSFLA
jgi:hypothetical protein